MKQSIFNLECSRHTIMCLPYFSFQNQSSISHPLCFWLSYGMLEWPTSMYFVAFCHCFLCSVGNFGDSFQALPELCASCSPPPRVPCCVALSPLPQPCPLTEPWVPSWLPLNPCEGRNIPPPAATIEPSAGYHVAFYTCFQLLRLPKLWLWLSDPAGKTLELSQPRHSVVAAGVGISPSP